MYHIGTTPRIITTMQYRRCHHAATARAFLMPNTVCITHTRLPHTDQMNIFTSNTQIGSSANSSVCTIELVQSEAGEELYTEATSVAFLALTSSSGSSMSLRPLGSLDPSTGAPCPSHSLLWHVMQPVWLQRHEYYAGECSPPISLQQLTHCSQTTIASTLCQALL